MNPRQTIILVSSRMGQLGDFVAGLQEQETVDLRITGSPEDALEWVRGLNPVLVVVDNQTRENSALALVQRLIMANAFAQTAVLSDRSDAEFHHLSEGLGILARLPILPGRPEARELLARLQRLQGPVRGS